jgi:hypothetical protein
MLMHRQPQARARAGSNKCSIAHAYAMWHCVALSLTKANAGRAGARGRGNFPLVSFLGAGKAPLGHRGGSQEGLRGCLGEQQAV